MEEVLLSEYHLTYGQIDGLWAYVGNKGEKTYPETDKSGQFWGSTMLDIDTRLRVTRGSAKTETEASIEVFQTLKRQRPQPGWQYVQMVKQREHERREPEPRVSVLNCLISITRKENDQ